MYITYSELCLIAICSDMLQMFKRAGMGADKEKLPLCLSTIQ